MKRVKKSDSKYLKITSDFFECRWRKCTWYYGDFDAIYHIADKIHVGFTYGGGTIIFKADVKNTVQYA